MNRSRSGTPERVSLRHLNRWTLARQLLLERADLDPVKAIERLAGLQAQWPRSPYIALWSRLRDFRVADLETALIEGRVVKSNLMRVTLHLVSAAEFHLYRAANEADVQSGWSASASAAGDSLTAIRAALIERATSGPLPRSEALAVMEALAPGMEEMDRRRLWYLLKSAHLVADPRHALFRSSPQGDHVLAPTLPEVAREVANRHLVPAHLAALGPATRADTRSW